MESIFQEALAHHRAGRLEDAEPLYRRAAAWRPERTLGNLGALLRTTGRLQEAEGVLWEALAAEPGNAVIRHTLGMTLLQLGRYSEGWRCYEARHELFARPTPPFPEWEGESLHGRRILVVPEQGLGDQILFARFVPHLAQEAAEVTLAAPRTLVRLFSQLPARVIHPQSWDQVACDVWVSMGSIPRWLDLGPADAPAPYLSVPGSPGAEWGTGLMLAGGERNPNMARLPGPPAARALRGLRTFVDLDPSASRARDFAETAGIVDALERVVSVDTSVAHLAGAMGKPCHVLMPRPASDWYANWKDDRSPWYPSLRILRQAGPGDWGSVVKALGERLAATSSSDGM